MLRKKAVKDSQVSVSVFATSVAYEIECAGCKIAGVESETALGISLV